MPFFLFFIFLKLRGGRSDPMGQRGWLGLPHSDQMGLDRPPPWPNGVVRATPKCHGPATSPHFLVFIFFFKIKNKNEGILELTSVYMG
jgi:hypothetical protein